LDGVLDEVISALASHTIYSAIISALLGGALTAFKPFVIGEEDLRKRADLHRERLIERIRESYKRILGDVFALASPPHDPDPVDIHLKELLRVTTVSNTLERLCTTTSACYSWLSVTIGVGIVGLLLSWAPDALKACVGIACSAAVLSQVLIFYILRRVTIRLRQCEDLT